MKKVMVVAFAAICAVLCGCATIGGGVTPAPKFELKDKFTKDTFKANNGVVLMVRYFVPDATSRLPLIVYLHGSGQNGSDNEKQLDDGVGSLYAFTSDRDDYKSVIVAPQCPAGVYWRDEYMLEALKEMIECMSSMQVVDPDRVYVTGFSMGGDATWKLALNWPELMSTIVPVCGGPLASMEPDIPDVPDEMANLNVWAFNAFDDGTVRPTYSKRIFARLWEIDPGENLNFTELVFGGHNGKPVFTNRDVLIWMVSTRRRECL